MDSNEYSYSQNVDVVTQTVSGKIQLIRLLSTFQVCSVGWLS